MSEIFSNFLGNIVLCLTNVLFFRIISKNKIKKSNLVTFLFLLLIIIVHTFAFLIGYAFLRTILTLFCYM